jgi:2-amino-4-hydroxy-6-hydroxymethyldihydropteridine diphosphokinase
VTTAFFSLGSNQGDRLAYLQLGVSLLVRDEPSRVSAVYETAPWGGVEQDAFLNCVLAIETSAPLSTMLARLRDAEAAAGRTREVRWGPRTLDCDLLLFGDEISDDPELLVPHPRLAERDFVLVPLHELEPSLATRFPLVAAGDGVVRVCTLNP